MTDTQNPGMGFDHSKTSFTEAIGISDERANKILKKVMALRIENDAISETIEQIIINFRDNITELSLAMYFYGQMHAAEKQIAKRSGGRDIFSSDDDGEYDFMSSYQKWFTGE